MNESQTQFVERIAREVIAVLRQRRLLDSSSSRSAAVSVRPPLGTCTGDYSKFPELAGRVSDGSEMNPGPQYADSNVRPAPEVQPIALSGIITARQLQEAMDAAPEGVAVLAPNARLTPLAADLVRQEPQKINRLATVVASGSPTAQAVPSVAAEGTHLPWLWWIDHACNAVERIVGARAPQLRPSAVGRSGGAQLVQVVRDIAVSIRANHIAGAILFVRNAAATMCYANRCASIRAVVGTSDDAVEQGIRDMGANVLVIERPQIGPRAMTAMVDRMLQQMPKVPTQVQRELADLGRV